MRGKQNLLTATYSENRITPADAGKTRVKTFQLSPQADHPRRCGENAVPQPVYTIKPGSPPQVRGKLVRGSVTAIRLGITPAGAGKTKIIDDYFTHYGDHPRRCGENKSGGCCVCMELGSPPRMRGKHQSRRFQARPRGITPADAGKTCCVHERTAKQWDHPRGCGENCSVPFFPLSFLGSPPRMRGKLPWLTPEEVDVGITPADAGKTSIGF